MVELQSDQAVRRRGFARGLWGVLATPFLADLSFDEASMARQVRVHRDCGSAGLVALGVFGESAQLAPEERRTVLDAVHREAADIPLVIGIAERDTGGAIASATDLLSRVSRATTSLMVQVNSPDPEPLVEHLSAIHDATGAGIVVQDYPVVSGVTIGAAELAGAVNACPFVVAVKSEAPPTSVAIAALVASTSVPVFGGLGGLGLLDELMAGAAGAMTGFSQPRGLAQTLAAWSSGGYAAARDTYLPWMPLVNFEAQVRVGLAIRKESLFLQGVFTTGAVRPPAVEMPVALKAILESHLAAVPPPA